MTTLWESFPTFDRRLLDIQYGKNRFYHDANHTSLVYSYAVELLQKYSKSLLPSGYETYFKQTAAWHDIVYDMNRTDNEEQSAVMFERSESAKLLDPYMLKNIAKTIRATANHWAPENEDLNDYSLIFLDADLAELAAPWPVFELNSDNIFREYRAMVANAKIDEFFKRRKQFYEMLLNKKQIYWKSPHLEEPARANLEMGVQLLESVKG